MLHSDQPIRSAGEDELGVQQFVQRLMRPILDWPPRESLVVGLYAPWGSGKTSVLNLLERALEDDLPHPRAVVARFNPWLYHDTDSLLRAFFATLRSATRTTGLLTRTRKESLGAAFEAISDFAVPVFGLLAQVATGGVDIVTPAAKATKGAVKAALKDGGEPAFEEQKKKAAAALATLGSKKTPARLIVLIDDLDRAEASEIRAMFKLVRLIADLPNVTYVVAMDYARVQQVLAQSDAAFGSLYIEKIVQVPVHLPPISEQRVRALVLFGVDEILTEGTNGTPSGSIATQAAQRGMNLDALLFWRVRTLRDRARLLNVFRFLVLAGERTLEIDACDALLIAFLQTFYPALVERIRRNRDFLTLPHSDQRTIYKMLVKDEERGRLRGEFYALLIAGVPTLEAGPHALGTEEAPIPDGFNLPPEHGATTSGWEHARLRSVMDALFPHAASGEDPTEKLTRAYRRENRIAAPERFDRYFAYVEQDQYASDAEVTAWLTATEVWLPRDPSAMSEAHWQKHVVESCANVSVYSETKVRDFVAKVSDRIEDGDVLASAPLAYLFAYAAGLEIVNDDDAANLVRRLLSRVEDLQEQEAFGRGKYTKGQLEALEEHLHNAFAVLMRVSSDVFGAIWAAAEHAKLWARRDRGAKEKVLGTPLPVMLRPVYRAGVQRATEAFDNRLDVFEHAHSNGGGPIWRWRDLLRENGEEYTPVRAYVRDLLQRKPERTPHVLGMFAGWSDSEHASLEDTDYEQIRRGANDIVGWPTFLRAVVRYKQLGLQPDEKYELIMRQLETKVARAAGRRRASALESEEE